MLFLFVGFAGLLVHNGACDIARKTAQGFDTGECFECAEAIGYSYVNAGRRTTMQVAGQPAVSYTYDNANRVTQISNGTSNISFGYG
jgi:hypothetical protein